MRVHNKFGAHSKSSQLNYYNGLYPRRYEIADERGNDDNDKWLLLRCMVIDDSRSRHSMIIIIDTGVHDVITINKIN